MPLKVGWLKWLINTLYGFQKQIFMPLDVTAIVTKLEQKTYLFLSIQA